MSANVNEAPTRKGHLYPADQALVASSLDQIAYAVRKAPDIDLRKVNAARDALANGTYEVNPERIARKLLRMDTALSRGGRRRGG